MVKKDSTPSSENEAKETKVTKQKNTKKVKASTKKASSATEKTESEVGSSKDSGVSGSSKEPMSLEERRRQEAQTFKVTVSFSLYKKLLSQAEEEGIDLNDYAAEILTEGCVVRAWQINALNSNNASNFSYKNSNFRPQSQPSRQSNFRNNGKKKGSHITYEDIMNDKASFLEYVRRKDKRR